MPELWTLWSYSYCIQQNKMLCIIFFVHSLCILALPCIIDEFYILINWNQMNSLTTPTRLGGNGNVSFTFEVCMCACKCEWVAWPWKLSVWMNILNWTMLNCGVWKRMSGQAKGDEYCNHVNIYLSKQNVNILFYSFYQGLLFQCKCEPIIYILWVASILWISA